MVEQLVTLLKMDHNTVYVWGAYLAGIGILGINYLFSTRKAQRELQQIGTRIEKSASH